MSKLKIIIAALILAFSLAGAYLIISREEKNSSLPNIIEGNNPVAMLKPQITNPTDTKNLTDVITEKISEDLASKNTDGGFITSGGNQFITASEPEQMAADLIAEAQKNFDPETLRPKIEENNLKIITDNTKESFTEYFNSLNQIVIAASKKIPAGFINPEKISLDDFKSTALVYGDFIQNLYDLNVPNQLTEIHKKQLELTVFKKNILEKIANAEQDPLTAIISIDSLLKIDQEFVILNKDMQTWITAHNL